MSLRTLLVESTWGYPIISAIHVLGIAWFGATVLASPFVAELRGLRRSGIALVLITGGILFWLQPAQYYNSTSFRLKMLLLIVVLPMKPSTTLALALWIAIIFASRGIAFF